MRNNWVNIILLLFILLGMVLSHNKQKEWSSYQSDKLDAFIAQQESVNYRDSTYFEHLKKCGFVSKEELKFDHRGYLYSEYVRYDGTKY